MISYVGPMTLTVNGIETKGHKFAHDCPCGTDEPEWFFVSGPLDKAWIGAHELAIEHLKHGGEPPGVPVKYGKWA